MLGFWDVGALDGTGDTGWRVGSGATARVALAISAAVPYIGVKWDPSWRATRLHVRGLDCGSHELP